MLPGRRASVEGLPDLGFDQGSEPEDAAVIAAAVQAGVEQVVMVSSLGVELGGIGGGRAHLPGEALMRESGLSWTLLHPSEFMSNTAWWRDTILGGQTYRLTDLRR